MMKQSIALKRLADWARRGRHVFTLEDLRKVFSEDGPKTLQAGLKRLVDEEFLVRPARGVYVFMLAHDRSRTIEHVAKALRRGRYNYVSLESALSEYGAISQVPMRLTVMTTGRKGVYPTPFGTIEFTHTERGWKEVLADTVDAGRPLRLAAPERAWRDLKRVGRNVHLVDERELPGG